MFKFGFNFGEEKKASPFKVTPKNLATGSQLNGQAQSLQNVTLIARQDIFSVVDDQQVLLVKAGTAVDPAMLEKLIRYGVQPNQFYIQRHASVSEESVMDDEIASLTMTVSEGVAKEITPRGNASTNMPVGMTNPIGQNSVLPSAAVSTEEIETALPSSQAVERQDIVVVDIEERSLKRLVNQLTVAGVSFSDIHPVKLRESLQWTLTKYTPSMLMVDENAFSATSLVAQVKALSSEHDIEQAVLLVNPASRTPKSMDVLQRQCDVAGIQLVYKPLNHFCLSNLLEVYKAKKQVQKQIKLAQFAE